MESTEGGRCGEIASDLAIIVVTAVQLVFFTAFHRYISWPVTQLDGSVSRLSMLTDGYSTWLPFPIAASIVVIVASVVMIVYDRYWFRQAAWIVFCLMGIGVVVSLLLIFPFDFSVLPNATAARVVPTAVTAFLIFMAVFYGVSAIALFARLRAHAANNAVS
jgi:hypothetical protein